MVRLIDADKLILHLNDYALQEAPFRVEMEDAYNAIKQCIEAVEEQPTAYDIDGVVEQLKRCYGIVRSSSIDYAEGLKYAYERAIGMVEVGGKNDN